MDRVDRAGQVRIEGGRMDRSRVVGKFLLLVENRERLRYGDRHD